MQHTLLHNLFFSSSSSLPSVKVDVSNNGTHTAGNYYSASKQCCDQIQHTLLHNLSSSSALQSVKVNVSNNGTHTAGNYCSASKQCCDQIQHTLLHNLSSSSSALQSIKVDALNSGIHSTGNPAAPPCPVKKKVTFKARSEITKTSKST